METNPLTVAIRPRTPWEAMDLGFRLVQTFAKSVFPPWIAIAAATCLLLMVLTGGRMLWTALLFWWLKPAYDRVLLKMFSRLLFGQTPGLRDTVRHLPESFASGLWLNLTLLRFNPSRSFHLPVWVLEGLRGKARRKRLQVLSQGIRSYPLWLLIACQAMEQVLAFSPLVLLLLLAPEGYGKLFLDQLLGMAPKPPALEIFTYGIFFSAIVIVEPLYVAAGFMLYIDRRTKLEGWDIELSFRQLGARLKRLGATASILLLATGLLVQTPPAMALSRSAAKTTITNVLDEAPFNQTTKTVRLVRRHANDTVQPAPDWDGLNPLWHYLAQVFRGAIWAGAIVLTLLSILYLRRYARSHRQGSRPGKRQPANNPSTATPQPEPMPDDVASAARDLFREGKFRQGLGLLYRATLIELQHHDRLRLNQSDTEADVLRLARQQLKPPKSEYLENLTRQWQQLAYGHQPLSRERAEALAAQWQRYFGAPS